MNVQTKYNEEIPKPNEFIKYLSDEKNRYNISIFLDNIKIPENIGHIIRLADAAKIKKLYLYNCCDIDNQKIIKVSRGKISIIHKELVFDLDNFLDIKLKENNLLVALEKTNKSILYTEFKPILPMILFVGSESKGINQKILDIVHHTIHIPMFGIGLSLNVAMSCAISVYKILEQLSLDKNNRMN